MKSHGIKEWIKKCEKLFDQSRESEQSDIESAKKRLDALEQRLQADVEIHIERRQAH